MGSAHTGAALHDTVLVGVLQDILIKCDMCVCQEVPRLAKTAFPCPYVWHTL